MSPAITPERWSLLRPLMDEALDLGIEDRAAFVAAIAVDQPDLAADLHRLLERHAQTDGMEGPAAERVGAQLLESIAQAWQPARFIGRQIGPFVLRRLLGAGGMGSVYEAERVSGGFRQRVAIKLISGVHPGLHGRFERERQILADLRHPNIPQLLDGGQTEDGTPYFVQEYVEGTSLLDFVAADLDVRLSLLVSIAEALAYAHRCKVLHRDIKPGNILVTVDGTAKLLDFGISKLLDDSSQPTLTQQIMGPMTPAYAAPEQFRGEPLGVASDIYQFGVLMFELVAGRSPYRVSTLDALGFARAVCETPPLSLQAVLDKAATDTAGHRLARQRRVDLDRVVQRCLEKIPGQRYPHMDALIADLQAVRSSGVPVASRLADRRHRTRIGIACTSLLLAAGLLWSMHTWLGDVWRDPWRDSPALHAMGLDRRHLHTARAGSEEMLRRALMTEARGDMTGALALLESVHDSDPATPIPALLLGYWGSVHYSREAALQWQAQAAQRLADIDDPVLDLLQRFVVADIAGDTESVLRYASALLELKPDAWFVQLARSHILNARGMTAAALRGLQQIQPERLDHRKLVDAIADRASFGDLPGARALAARIDADPDDPEHAFLEARLAYTAGDLTAARDAFAIAVERARSIAHFALEARGLLYLGVVDGSLGNLATAAASLRLARQRFSDRGQQRFATESSLALAQIHALLGDGAAVAAAIDAARDLHRAQHGTAVDPMIELFAARLLGLPPQPSTRANDALRMLTDARAALLRGDRNEAISLLDDAEGAGIAASPWLEEFALMRKELDLPVPQLPPLDPPFQPYPRFAGRWALGAGDSVTPPRKAPAGQ
jgi:serine/threonine protein kinase/tetratricopeptide (TPR) repeat protein